MVGAVRQRPGRQRCGRTGCVGVRAGRSFRSRVEYRVIAETDTGSVLLRRAAVVQSVPIDLAAVDKMLDFIYIADAGDGGVSRMAGEAG